jgi:hypothetical protein
MEVMQKRELMQKLDHAMELMPSFNWWTLLGS